MPAESNKQGTILVVDDDRAHRTMLRTLLGGWGYAVSEADDGARAIEKVHERPYDLVLMDVRMVNVSGLEALPEIKHYNPAIPVLIMTAYSSVETAVDALKKGAYDYLTKPLDFDEAINAIDLCHKLGIWTYGNFIIGFPEQTAESIERTAQFAVNSGLDMISVYIRLTVIQLATPDAMRGRVSAVNSVAINASNELGDFRAGVTAAVIGTVPAVLAGGAATLAVTALCAWLFPQMRRIDRLDEVR